MGKFFRLDWSLITPCLILFTLGFLSIASTSQELAGQEILFLGISLLVFLILKEVDYRIYGSISLPLFFLGISAIALTFLLGQTTRGAVRWIAVGDFLLQPSEIVKPVMVIFAASFCSSGKPLTLSRLLKFFFLVSFPLILIFRQPDLGNAIVYAVFFLAILFAGGAKPIFLLLTATVSTAILPIFWHLLKGYQRERILTFLSPTHDPLGAGYNAIQAEIAVGSGELFGRGLGRGTQSHLKFLPEFHTDFVFAAISEELGFLGSIITLLAFGFLLWQIIAIGQNSKDRFAYLISIGAFAQILIHVVINIGMNIGLVPITGITLPLVSYGGSSLISTMATLGIVANIHMTRSSRNA